MTSTKKIVIEDKVYRDWHNDELPYKLVGVDLNAELSDFEGKEVRITIEEIE